MTKRLTVVGPGGTIITDQLIEGDNLYVDYTKILPIVIAITLTEYKICPLCSKPMGDEEGNTHKACSDYENALAEADRDRDREASEQEAWEQYRLENQD
jgi:hypothetical protein